jgi:hypothetical protein
MAYVVVVCRLLHGPSGVETRVPSEEGLVDSAHRGEARNLLDRMEQVSKFWAEDVRQARIGNGGTRFAYQSADGSLNDDVRRFRA